MLRFPTGGTATFDGGPVPATMGPGTACIVVDTSR
jgi:hypothetical protein